MFLKIWIASCLLFVPAVTFATEVVGIPRILDGDTVEIASARIRLLGIDAPESDQVCLTSNREAWNCGLSSRDELIKQFGKSEWVCRATGTDRYGRLLARCAVNGQDVQQWMVRNGWALSFVRYSHSYDADEEFAKNQQAGLWTGSFVAPWDWRDRTKETFILGTTAIPKDSQLLILPGGTLDNHPPGCEIKGNANRKRACIYHLPGSRWYARIKMKSPGKRWFCTAADAEAAGCRPARE